MTENQKKFLEAASKNEELRKKINEMDQKASSLQPRNWALN